MDIAKLKLTIDEVGNGQLVLNGMDISSLVNEILIKSKAGRLNEITLRLLTEIDAESLVFLENLKIEKAKPRKKTANIRGNTFRFKKKK
jgi:hypothetical protein